MAVGSGNGNMGGNMGGLTDCFTKKAEADRKSGMGIVGHFTPSCDVDGNYSADQCHGSTGYCWCALADGKEVAGTRVRGARQDCSIHRRTGE